MNGVLLVSGIIFLIMGTPMFLYAPNLVYGFYSYTGLDNLSIYQDERAISGVITGSQLSGLLLLVSGFIFISLSKYY